MRKLIVVLLLVCAGTARGQSPCDGKITDKLDHPMNAGAVSKPAVGATYIDPVFGTPITRITNALPAEGANAVIRTTYATMRGWNADGSLIMLWHRNVGYEIYDGDAPYAWRKTISFSTAAAWPTDIEHVIWDTTDPLVFWFPSTANAQPRFYKYTINLSGQDTITLYRDFAQSPANCPTDFTPFGIGTDPHDMSRGSRKLIGLQCGVRKFLYSITENSILAIQPAGSDWAAPWPLPDETGVFFPDGVRVTDLSFNTLLTLSGITHFGEHASLAKTTDYNAFLRVDFDDAIGGSLVRYRLDTGAGTAIMGQSNGWPYPRHDTHMTPGAVNNSNWIAHSSIGWAPVGQTVLDNELVLANVYTGAVCRVAHLRTYEENGAGTWGYWGEPHPQISPDGYRVLFNSDFLGSNTVDTYVADLRPQAATVITTTLPNGVKDEAYSQTLQALGGAGAPYTWTKTVGVFPAGLSMSSAGVISGTPTTVESQTFTVQACDSVPACDTQQLTIVVQERPSISTASPLPGATVGSSYSTSLVASGGVAPRTWTIASGTICAGLSLASDGTISGTPITLQTCNFTARVTDSHAQPITQTKAFALTVSLPAGCPPGGSSVCMRITPSDNEVLVRYGQVGLARESSCTATLKLGNTPVGSPKTTDDALSRRTALFTGLTADTQYTLDLTCEGLDAASDQVRTLPTISGGPWNMPIALEPNPVLSTATQVEVEWGQSVVTENTSGNVACSTGCTVTLSLSPGIYLLRHTWKNAGGTQIAQSDTRHVVVN